MTKLLNGDYGMNLQMTSTSSFINGIIVGAGIVLGLMSFGFLLFIAPLENIQGVSSTEIRVAIFLGGLVAAVALAYEFYSKKQVEPKKEEIKEKIKEELKDELKEELKSDSKKDES